MASSFPVIKGRYLGRSRQPPRKLLAAHLKYAQHRPFGPDETRADRALFSQENDLIRRADAVSDIMLHTSQQVQYHKIVLSPADYEYIDDFRAWTRALMRELEERKGVQLHWYAVIHAHPREHTTTPHVHVVLAGAGEDHHTGALTTIRMDSPDYAFLRTKGREHSNFDLYQQIQQTLDELHHTEQQERHDRAEPPGTPDWTMRDR